MAETILTPGNNIVQEDTPQNSTVQYLNKDNYLGEFETQDDIEKVRRNLDILPNDAVYTKTETDTKISEELTKAIRSYLNQEDPHGLLPIMEAMVEGLVKQDGSVPFTAPQSGVTPVKNEHLTTKKFVSDLLTKHINSDDPHQILPQVSKILNDYIKSDKVYTKNDVYTKLEIDKNNKQYVTRDGEVPFIKPQKGVYPTQDSHISTKKYVDDIIRKHLTDVDPHGFISILNNRLTNYIKKKDVYDKTQTYSRSQLDSIIYNIVDTTINTLIDDSLSSINDKLEYIRKQNYVKSDGSISFSNPQSGVDATKDSELVTLRQLNEHIKENFEKNYSSTVWMTSGPVESSVGFVEEGQPVPNTLTFQELMDAIFYGKRISLSAPESVEIGKQFEVVVCVHSDFDYAELLVNDDVKYIFNPSDLESGCATVTIDPLEEDAKVTFKVYYNNGAEHEESVTVKCVYPIFMGLLPKWKGANTVTMDYLKELNIADETNNQFFALEDIKLEYSFSDPQLRHPFVVVPKDYPKLKNMTITPQKFGIEAFNIIDAIPLQVEEQTVIYTIYVYKQALSSLNQEVTFNFE